MKKKYLIIILLLIGIIVTIFFVLNNKYNKKNKNCTKNCKIGDQIIFSDNSSWHIIDIKEDTIVLFSDATIEENGYYCSILDNMKYNTCKPIAFDSIDARSNETNPYCLYPDLGCSMYEKNNIDVFEDSTIKQLIDQRFAPKLKKVLNTEDIVFRLITADEFLKLKELEQKKEMDTNWLYYNIFWTMTSYNQYSVFLLNKDNLNLTYAAPYIFYKAGARPVIEINKKILYNVL